MFLPILSCVPSLTAIWLFLISCFGIVGIALVNTNLLTLHNILVTEVSINVVAISQFFSAVNGFFLLKVSLDARFETYIA